VKPLLEKIMKKPVLELPLLDQLFARERSGLSVEERLGHLQAMRTAGDISCQIDRALLERISTLEGGIEKARDLQRKLKESLDRLTAIPWFPAIYLQAFDTPEGQRALVQFGNTRRVVRLEQGVDRITLRAGDEVFLSNELNVIVARSPNASPRGGETAVFERRTQDGRLVLCHHDEEIVMDPAAALQGVPLAAGDIVRCDRAAWIAFEKIERSKGGQLYLEETPTVTFAEIGGLNSEIERIKRALNLHVVHADAARRYGLRRKGSILLVGPSGTGKTMLARALANWLATLNSEGRARFMSIKPSGLHSMWYGQSEANYREAFRVAREAGETDPQIPVVMFFDEVDSVGMARGHANGHVDDRVLTAFMTELDGLSHRGNIVVIGATNRRDALDPALLRPGRLGDLVLEIPRPRRRAALDIFATHLRADAPYARNGHGDNLAMTRTEILETVVSRIYAPNAGNELATLQFRDGSRRPVRAADLVSGAVIANIANSALERACAREIETGEGGLRLVDLARSADEAFEAAVGALTPANCRQHLADLPHDLDVVSVQRPARKALNARTAYTLPRES
jgi:proteasome-associated ATPase